ncbi:hypothetical protein D3C87_1631920 [compost metagenome]
MFSLILSPFAFTSLADGLSVQEVTLPTAVERASIALNRSALVVLFKIEQLNSAPTAAIVAPLTADEPVVVPGFGAAVPGVVAWPGFVWPGFVSPGVSVPGATGPIPTFGMLG